MNIGMLLQMAREAVPERRALTCHHEDFTYRQLYAGACVAAGIFRSSGCHYVAMLDVSSPAVPIALMGAAMAGLPYVPLNYRLTDAELDALIERITPVCLILDENGARYRSRQGVTVWGRQALLEAVSGSEEPAEESWPEDPSAVAVQLFTSGTTGTPKTAVLRHAHLVSYVLETVDFMSAGEQEATLVAVPPYHIAGISAVMSSIYACRRIVQLPDFSAAAWLELAERENVSHAFLVPTMLARIIDHLETTGRQANLPSLTAIAYGGGKMPMPVLKRALTMLPQVEFANAYGLTETSSTITLLGPEDHRAALASKDPNVRHRLGSVGKPLPSVEIEIRDESGQPLSSNQPGEIYVRGPQVSGEYLERKALEGNGWFPTRDVGYMDEHGYLYLSGRADDLIVRGGENISPAEIEDVLKNHNAVADAAAVAIPSEEWGEAVGAAVVLKPGHTATVQELQQLVKAHLRSSRVPEVIRFEKELPYNETGKLLRKFVKQLFV
jgi:acyl-CoA synthetase (AMP-forming)/AMP-acid ligase II